MKKIAYLIYVVVIITLLVCVKVNVFSSSIGTVIFFVLGMVELLFCFGSYYPTQTQHIETLQTMQVKLDSRNDPIQIKLCLFLIIPIFLAIFTLQSSLI